MADESATSDSTQSSAPQTVPEAPSTAPLNQEEDEGWKQDGFGRWYIPKGEWWAVFDAKTQRIYYQNQTSQQTQWTVPEAWKKPTWEAEVEKMMKKPARRQAKAQDKSKVHWRPEGAFEYNIWYHKWVGEHWKGDRERGAAETRCILKRDTGYTRGSLQDPKGEKQYLCLYFARGCCENGAECSYLHRPPVPSDLKRIDLGHDCFGRGRHSNHRDDMGGVGSFDKDCRTLYVSGLQLRSNLEEILNREFGEWGDLEEVKIIPRLHIAFITYTNRLYAEFAKVAMGDQTIEGGEMINVRWAYDDPNPKSKQIETQRKRDQFTAAMDHYFTEGGGANLPKRLQPYTEGGLIGEYPDTDPAILEMMMTPEEKEKAETKNRSPKGQFTQARNAQLLKRVEEDCDRLDQALKRTEGVPEAPPSDGSEPAPIPLNTTNQNPSRFVDPYRSLIKTKKKKDS